MSNILGSSSLQRYAGDQVTPFILSGTLESKKATTKDHAVKEFGLYSYRYSVVSRRILVCNVNGELNQGLMKAVWRLK